MACDINVTNKRGITPLMEASRTGHTEVLQTLLTLGADPYCVSKNGHTAGDLALFWQHRECYNLLPKSTRENPKEQQSLFFCSPPSIDRSCALREDENALRTWLVEDVSTRFVLFHRLSPVTCIQQTKLKVAWTTLSELLHLLGSTSMDQTTLLDEVIHEAVFLGIYNGGVPQCLDKVPEGSALFTIDVSRVSPDSLGRGVDVAPGVMGMLGMEWEEAALCGQARSLIDWNHKNGYCSACGSATRATLGGYKRVCDDASCSTHKGIHNISHPRMDPSVITLVLNPHRNACILARGRHFAPGMYSCVAGFVEPGESVEQACRREVKEEVGVPVGQVTYISSQPWPSPSALMLGCIGEATSTDLQMDETELEDARWFDRPEVVEMITRSHEKRLSIPPQQAIANHLVSTWLKQTAFT